MNRDQNSKITTWGNTSTTLGAVGLIGVCYTGSAASGTITILDGTAIKIVIPILSTAPFGFYEMWSPTAFSNLKTDVTGTMSHSVIFIPRP